MMGPTDEEFHDWFTTKPVVGPDFVRLDNIHSGYNLALAALLNNTRPSAHRTDAVRSLLKARQAAVFALTHGPQPVPRKTWSGDTACPYCGTAPGTYHDLDCEETRNA